MSQDLKIIGKIEIPEPKVKEKCTCDYCKRALNDSFGDPRVEITRVSYSGKKIVNYICDDCNQMDWDNMSQGGRLTSAWDEMRYNGL